MEDKPKITLIKEYRDSNIRVYGRLQDDLLDTIRRYKGEMKVVEVLGILTLVADDVKTW